MIPYRKTTMYLRNGLAGLLLLLCLGGLTAQAIAQEQQSMQADEINNVVLAAAKKPATVIREQQVRSFIQHWVKVWQNQDVAAYLACYSSHFTPTDGSTLNQWRIQRSKRLLSPRFIKLSLEDMQLEQNSADNYQARFLQSYQNDRYQDQVYKQLQLRLEKKGWRIVQEQATPLVSAATDIPATATGPAPTTVSSQPPDGGLTLSIGPCINSQELHDAQQLLSGAELSYNHQIGVGPVKMFRVREGVYSMQQGQERLKQLRNSIVTTYPLPAGDGQLGVYLAAFHNRKQAERYVGQMEEKGITAELVEAKVEMSGIILTAQVIDQETSMLLVQLANEIGLTASLKEL